tara:strand:- start:170 stop:370 length:201 start_codon:yes stop_codon:yes gene_type:complete
MLIQILLIISIAANLRAFYIIGKQYKFKSDTVTAANCQGGRKHLYQELEKEDVSLNDENKILCKDK